MDLQIINTIGTNPVTLTEAKNYIRVTNTADDTLIQSIIENATKKIESWINTDIVSKERAVYLERVDEPFKLYYAPINSDADLTIEVDGVVQTSDTYELKGLENPLICLQSSLTEKVKVTYTTKGISDVGIKPAILAYAAFLYHGRDAMMSTNWKIFANLYKQQNYYGTR